MSELGLATEAVIIRTNVGGRCVIGDNNHGDPLTRRLLDVIAVQTEIATLGSDLGAVMTLVAERASVLTHAAGAAIELAEGADMVYRAACGIAAGFLGLRLSREGSLSGLCVAQGETLRSDDTETDARVNRDTCRRIGLRSMIVVPLRFHEESVGVLKVMAREPGAFDDEDLRILDLLCGLVAAAMYHAARSQRDELFYRATHDALTDLPNRSVFFERLRLALAQARRQGHRVGVLNLDMDGLKPINDRHGHGAGDAAIRELAVRLKHVTREADTVARLGGDEFGVVLSRVDDGDGVARQARRLVERVEQPFDYQAQALALGVSVGSAIYPDDAQDLDALVEKADQAMYASKREKPGRAR